MRRNTIWTLARALISVALLWFVISSVGVDRLQANLEVVPLSIVLAALGLSVLNVGLSAYKWGLLLSIKGIELTFRRLFVYYYVGQFFSAFLPTMVGGDGVRAYYLHSGHEAGSDSVSSVLVERLTGLLAVLAIGGIATAFSIDHIPTGVAATVLLVCIPGGIVVTALLFTDVGRRLFERTVFRIGAFDLGDRLSSVFEAIYEYRDAGPALLPVVLLSIVFRVIVVLNHYLVALGLGMEVPLGFFFVFVPLVELLLFVPISIQGFGVRETAYVYLFGSVGAESGVALSLGVLMQLVLAVFNNLLGGVIYLLFGERPT